MISATALHHYRGLNYGRQALCELCARKRATLRRTERRRLAEDTTIAVPQVAIEQLAKMTADLDRAIAHVLIAAETRRPIDGPALKLTKLTKHMSVLVSDEFVSRLQQVQRMPKSGRPL